MEVNQHDGYECDLNVLEQGSGILLADPGQRITDSGVFALKKKLPDQKFRMTGAELKELRLKHGLSQPDIAALARKSLTQRTRGRQQSSSVGRWENDEIPIPLDTAELLRTKLSLLEKKRTTFKALVETPLDQLVTQIYG